MLKLPVAATPMSQMTHIGIASKYRAQNTESTHVIRDLINSSCLFTKFQWLTSQYHPTDAIQSS